MTRNKLKAEYEASNPEAALNVPAYGDWLFGVMKSDVERFSRLLRDNRFVFTGAFGRPQFTWIDSDRRTNLVWKFPLQNGVVAYVFTGNRGTSFELAHLTPDAGEQLVDFIKTRILPIVTKDT